MRFGLPLALNVGAISVAEGVRAGVAVAVTVLAGAVFGLPDFGLAALGALLTCFADPGGPVKRRAPAVLMFALASGVLFGAFGFLRDFGAGVAALAAGVAIFGACYARVYGQGGLQVGNLLSVVIVLALDKPAGGIWGALGQGANFSAGALWAAALTLVIWRLHPYRPSRVALAEVAGKLAVLAKELGRLAREDEGLAAFEAHAAVHRRGVREAIEMARGVALDIFRRRGMVSRRGAMMAERLAALEQIFGGLIALSDILEGDAGGRAAAAGPLRLVAGWLAAMGPDIVEGVGLDTEKKRRSLAILRCEIAKLGDCELGHVLAAMVERLAVLVTASAPVGQNFLTDAVLLPVGVRIFSPLRANWNFGSAPMRHALRAGIVAMPVLFCTILARQPFAHWATITMILCLQPYFSATRQRTVERVVGTALGGVLAAGVGFFTQTQMELAVTMLPLTVFAFSIRAVSYGAFVAALTPMIVLLVEQIAPGANEVTVAWLRVVYTVAGGVLAVAANFLLWPGFEHVRLETSVKAAVTAHVGYLRAVFSLLLDGAGAPDGARRAAGMASNNLEAAIARALAEPHRGADAAIERAAVTDAALRRIAGRLSVMALDRNAIAPAGRARWEAWRDWLVEGLAGRGGRRPELPEDGGRETLTRLARQVELIGG